jgi:hypothetical protein
LTQFSNNFFHLKQELFLTKHIEEFFTSQKVKNQLKSVYTNHIEHNLMHFVYIKK